MARDPGAATRAQRVDPDALPAAAPGRSGYGGRSLGLRRPSVQALTAFVCYLAVWVIGWTFPMVLHPRQAQLDQASMDPNFYVWCLRWWPYALTHGLNPLHTTQIGAPAGYDLAWVTSIPPLSVLSWPVILLSGPVATFSMLVVAAVPVSAWAAFVLCRRLTGRFWAALASGAVYGFSAYELNHIASGQLNLAFAPIVPLIAYLVVLWRDEAIGSRLFTGLLSLAMTVQFYLFNETFAGLTMVWAVAFALGYWLAGPAGRPFIGRLARLVAIAYVLTAFFAAPDVAYTLTRVPHGFNRDPAGSAVGLLNLVVPRQGQTFGLSWLTSHAAWAGPDADGYIGIPLLVLVTTWAIITWSSRFTRFLVAITVLILLGAFGPAVQIVGWSIRLPWQRLWYLPLARSSYPARLMTFVFLALAVMVALWLASPSRRIWPRWLLAVLTLAAIGANTPALALSNQPGTPAFITTGEYRHYIARGQTVVILSQRGNAGMLWQAQTNFYFRLAGGFVNRAITSQQGYPAPVAALAEGPLTPARARDFRLFVEQARIRVILVERTHAGAWPSILGRLGLNRAVHDGVLLFYPARVARLSL